MICKNCGVNLASEWVAAPDSIELCHLCYEKEYALKGEGKCHATGCEQDQQEDFYMCDYHYGVTCGDHLVDVKECGCKL